MTDQTKPEFIEFLQETLIPDIKDMSMPETAKDFETCVAFMELDNKTLIDCRELIEHGDIKGATILLNQLISGK